MSGGFTASADQSYLPGVTATLSARLVRPLFTHPIVGSYFQKAARARSAPTVDALDDLDRRLDHDVVVDLIEAVIRETGDERLGLHGARLLDPGVFHVLDYMTRTSATVLEALERVGRFHRLLHDGFRFEVERTSSNEIIKLGVRDGLRFPPALAEFCMGSLFIGGYRMGLPRVAAAVFFAHQAPPDLGEFEAVFRVPVYFNAPDVRAVFPVGAFDIPLPAADPALCAVIEHHAERLLERLPRTKPLIEKVRSLLALELRGGNPTLKHLADKLGIAPRTLRRRLEADGTTFHEVLDDLRRDLALSYLKQSDIELEEAAFLLGYSEASAFGRAFKRWTGQSVTQYRNK